LTLGFYHLEQENLPDYGIPFVPAANTALPGYGESPAPVPLHIRNAPTPLMKELGYNRGYQYAHNSPEAYIPQDYLPDQLRDALFYVPGTFGFEPTLAERMERWAQLKQRERPSQDPAG